MRSMRVGAAALKATTATTLAVLRADAAEVAEDDVAAMCRRAPCSPLAEWEPHHSRSTCQICQARGPGDCARALQTEGLRVPARTPGEPGPVPDSRTRIMASRDLIRVASGAGSGFARQALPAGVQSLLRAHRRWRMGAAPCAPFAQGALASLRARRAPQPTRPDAAGIAAACASIHEAIRPSQFRRRRRFPAQGSARSPIARSAGAGAHADAEASAAGRLQAAP